MASARVLREVILTPERTLHGLVDQTHNRVGAPFQSKKETKEKKIEGKKGCILGFELVRENQVGVLHNFLVCWYYIVVDV